MKPRICCYCLKPSEGNYSINVEISKQADLWLCDDCGKDPGLPIGEILRRVENREPLIWELIQKQHETENDGISEAESINSVEI